MPYLNIIICNCYEMINVRNYCTQVWKVIFTTEYDIANSCLNLVIQLSVNFVFIMFPNIYYRFTHKEQILKIIPLIRATTNRETISGGWGGCFSAGLLILFSFTVSIGSTITLVLECIPILIQRKTSCAVGRWRVVFLWLILTATLCNSHTNQQI